MGGLRMNLHGKGRVRAVWDCWRTVLEHLEAFHLRALGVEGEE